MYCPECGAHLADGKNFCGNCGKKVTAQKVAVSKPHLGIIATGILIILILYLIPISGGTLAKNAEICSSRYASMFYGCDANLFWIFYIGWAFAIVLMAGGLFNKEKQ